MAAAMKLSAQQPLQTAQSGAGSTSNTVSGRATISKEAARQAQRKQPAALSGSKLYSTSASRASFSKHTTTADALMSKALPSDGVTSPMPPSK